MIEALLFKGFKNLLTEKGVVAVKLVFLGSTHGSWTGLTELQVFDSENNNIALNNDVTASASSSYPADVYQPYKLKDGIVDNSWGYWCSETGKGANIDRSCWAMLSFKEPVEIQRLVMHTFNRYQPTSLDVEISKDGIVFQKLGDTITTGYIDGKTSPPLIIEMT